MRFEHKGEQVVDGLNGGKGDGVGWQLQCVDDFPAEKFRSLVEIIKVRFGGIGDAEEGLDVILDGQRNILDF
jgi:hypothetical protein